MRKLLNKLLLKIAEYCVKVSNKLVLRQAEEEHKAAELVALNTVKVEEDFTIFKDLPTSFKTFKEGLESKNFFTRHDAAVKLVSWYIYEQGRPMVEDIVKAAEVLLEEYPNVTQKDRDDVLTSWKKQAVAQSEEEREIAYNEELNVFHRVSKLTK